MIADLILEALWYLFIAAMVLSPFIAVWFFYKFISNTVNMIMIETEGKHAALHIFTLFYGIAALVAFGWVVGRAILPPLGCARIFAKKAGTPRKAHENGIVVSAAVRSERAHNSSSKQPAGQIETLQARTGQERESAS